MRSAESCCRHDLAAFRARLDGYSASTPLFEALTTENTEFETPLSADFPTQLVLHKTHDNNNVNYVKIFFLLAYSWFLELLTIFPIWCGFDCVSAIAEEVFFDFYESLWILVIESLPIKGKLSLWNLIFNFAFLLKPEKSLHSFAYVWFSQQAFKVCKRLIKIWIDDSVGLWDKLLFFACK